MTASGTGEWRPSSFALVRPGDNVVVPVYGEFGQRLAEAIELAGGNAVKVFAEPGNVPAHRRRQGGDQEDRQPEGRLSGPQRDEHGLRGPRTSRSWRWSTHDKGRLLRGRRRLQPGRICDPGRRLGRGHVRHGQPKVPSGAARASPHLPEQQGGRLPEEDSPHGEVLRPRASTSTSWSTATRPSLRPSRCTTRSRRRWPCLEEETLEKRVAEAHRLRKRSSTRRWSRWASSASPTGRLQVEHRHRRELPGGGRTTSGSGRS